MDMMFPQHKVEKTFASANVCPVDADPVEFTVQRILLANVCLAVLPFEIIAFN